MTATLNLTSLTEPVSPAQLQQFRQQMIAADRHERPKIGVVLGCLIGAVLAVLLFGALAISITSGKSPTYTAGALSILGLVCVVVLLFLVAMVRIELFGKNRWEQWLRLEAFAGANNLRYERKAENPGYPGTLFQIGHNRQIIERLYQPGDLSPDFGNYQYMTGQGRGTRAFLCSYLAIRLPRRLPHFMLDATANGKLGRTLSTTFTRDQVLSLEGGFDDHFTLYCPAEYERDALYLLTPDLMELLIDSAGTPTKHTPVFDVEVIDDWMFLYSTTFLNLIDPGTVTRLYSIINTVGQRMRGGATLYADPRTAPEPSPLVDVHGQQIQTRMSNNQVADTGRRLRRGTPVAAIVTALLLASAGVGAFVVLVLFG